MTLYLHGMGHYHPETEISNEFLETLDIGTTDEWIVDRVGIRTRRTVLPLDYIRKTRNADTRATAEAALMTNAQLGARAAELALARAGVAKEQIGLVISGTTSPSFVCPAEASLVAAELEIAATAFDINSACSSFVTQLYNLSQMRPETLPEFVLLIAVETLTRTSDYSDRSNCVLFGDGAAAAVVSTRHRAPVRLLHPAIASDPGGAEKVITPWSGYFGQDGRAVQMFAIRKTRSGYEKLRAQLAAEQEESGGEARPLHFIGHQANLRVLEQVCKYCEIAPARHHSNVEVRGNTGCASAPSVLSMQWEKFTPRDDLALVVVGGGLTWAHTLLRFGGEEA